MTEHPFLAAWRTRDLDAWSRALAPDVELRSPVLSSPFRGRAAVTELYEVLFESLGEVEVTGDLTDADAHAFFWSAEAGGRTIDGVDLVRANADGAIREITVYIRPLVDIGAFSALTGPPLVAKRGVAQGLVLKLLMAPLRLMLALADVVGVRLAQRR